MSRVPDRTDGAAVRAGSLRRRTHPLWCVGLASSFLALLVLWCAVDGEARGRGGGGKGSRRVALRIRHLPSLGPRDAAVTAVLLSHFGCAYNDRILDAYRSASRSHPGQVRLVFMLFGLNPRLGGRWRAAAEAALAAQAQGRFWTFAELLFSTRTQLRAAQLPMLAASVGVRPGVVSAALARGSYRAELTRQVRLSSRFLRGVSRRCPTLWINGTILSGYLSTSRLRVAFDRAWRQVSALRASPMP